MRKRITHRRVEERANGYVVVSLYTNVMGFQRESHESILKESREDAVALMERLNANDGAKTLN